MQDGVFVCVKCCRHLYNFEHSHSHTNEELFLENKSNRLDYFFLFANESRIQLKSEDRITKSQNRMHRLPEQSHEYITCLINFIY